MCIRMWHLLVFCFPFKSGCCVSLIVQKTNSIWIQLKSAPRSFNMSILKSIRFGNICSIVLAWTVIFDGISIALAHCTTAANQRFNSQRNFSQTNSLSAEQTFSTFMWKGQDARFTIVLDKATPFSISIQTNRPSDINTQLFFNETVNLSKYLGKNSSIMSIPCAPIGQYDILINSKSNAQLKLNVTQQEPFLAQNLSQYVQTSRIRYENRVHKQQILFKWDKSKFDIHAMQYCLAINSYSNQNNFCDAIDHVIGQSPKLFCSHFKALNNYYVRPADRILDIDSKRGTALACTGFRNKQILRGFIPHKKYFVDIFGIHTTIPGLTFKLGSTFLVFNRSNPIELIEDEIEHGRLSEFDRRSSFVFKTPHNRTSQTVKFLIIPCNHPVRVKMFTQKKLLKTLDIVSATTIQLNKNLMDFDRFLLKFVPLNVDDTSQRIYFKLAATRKSNFINYPTLPMNTRVAEIASLSTCKNSTITWHSPHDHRSITYCIAVTKLKTKDVDDYNGSINTCEAEKRLSNKMSLKPNYDCFRSRPDRNDMERYQLKKLIPGHNYVIQVMLTIGKEFISYQTLKIHKSHHCYVPILNDHNQLPNSQPNFIEDNRILVP